MKKSKPIYLVLRFAGTDDLTIEFPDEMAAYGFYKDVLSSHGDFIDVRMTDGFPLLINKNHLICVIEKQLLDLIKKFSKE